ncbi:MAG: hypothetical protein ACI4Q3_00070 [Kiritimatiellia bacterium]
MKIPLKLMELRPKGHVVGCGMQGSACLALDLSPGRGGKWKINWSLAGTLGDEAFASRLAKLAGPRHFWVSPTEEGGLQVETARAIEIPDVAFGRKGAMDDFFRTQVKSRFVNETVVFGGLRVKGVEVQNGRTTKLVHNVGGGAIRDNVRRDYLNWYGMMGIRRPHIASTGLALANSYLALYPAEKRRAKPLRLVVLKGRSVHRAILMDDWKYIDEVLLPRMEGDDATVGVIEGRIQGWIEFFRKHHPTVVGKRTVEPLVVAVSEKHISAYEHWDLWGEHAMDLVEMTESVAEAVLNARDIAPIAFGMALQGGC